MADALYEMLPTVKDEKTFIAFLRALRERCEADEHAQCWLPDHPGCGEMHWESFATKDFLRSAEDWAGGDFADGEHGGEPILRRVATMLMVGRWRARD